MVVPIIYMDDIIVFGDVTSIEEVKGYLKKIFQTKDLRLLHYFLGLEVHILEVRLFCPK